MGQNDQDQRWIGKFIIQSQEAIGELVYKAVEGVTLEARLWPAPKDHSRLEVYPIINGHTAGDRPCTIVDAGDRYVAHTRSEQFHRIAANTLLLNVECKSADEPLFTTMSFRSPALTAFYQPRGIKVKRLRKSLHAFNASYKPGKPIKGKWGRHRIQISAFAGAPMHQADDGTLQAVEFAEYQINFSAPVSLNVVLSHLTALEFFLGIVVGQFSGCPTVFLGQKPDSTNYGPVRLLRSRLWYATFDYDTYKPTLVSMKELGKQTIPVLSRWFDLYPGVERIADVYRDSQLISVLETGFLFLVQSLEGLHRTCLSRKAIFQDEFDSGLAALQAAVLADLSDSGRQFFASRLENFYNEPGLRGRLKDFLRLIRVSIPTALDHAEKDIDYIVRLRNKFSHGTLSDSAPTFSLQAIDYYLHVVQTMFDIGLLSILEVPKDALSNMYYGNLRYSLHDDRRGRLFRKKRVGRLSATGCHME